MTEAELIEYLNKGGSVRESVWTFNKTSMNCYDDCCYTTFSSLEEAVKTIHYYCNIEDLEVC